MGLVAETLRWRFACPDWAARLANGQSLLPDLPLFETEADRAVAIFNKLRLPDVPDQPLLADAAGEWLRDMVRALFGSMDPDSRVRMVREIFGLVPKKNSKTTGGAAIMMTALLANQRPRAEFLLVGPTQDIADLAFQQAAGMIDADAYLRTRYQVSEHVKTITDLTNKARLKIKTFDMKVATGTKPAGILLDELHIMSTIPNAARIIGQLRGGMLANPEAFMVMITTQSDRPPAGAFKAELEYARAVRDGRIVDNVSTLPMLYEFPEGVQTDDKKPWRDPKLWPMVLPNLGKSITLDRLISDYRTAREKGDEEERRWASQHLNIEIGLGLHAARWRGADYWLAAAEPALTLDDLLVRCEVVVVGIDGGGLDDLFGLAALGRERDTGRWLHWGHAWAWRGVLDIRKEIAAELADFERQGDLTLVDAPDGDIDGIVAVVAQINSSGLLPDKAAVGLDPQGVGVLIDALVKAGLTDDQLEPVRQGWALSSAVWSCERKLKDKALVHGGRPMMAWCVGNAKAESKGNGVSINKEASGRSKIDPLIALFNAAKLMERNPVAATIATSPWDDPNFRLVA